METAEDRADRVAREIIKIHEQYHHLDETRKAELLVNIKMYLWGTFEARETTR